MAAAVVEGERMTARYSMHREPVWRDRSDFIINARLPEDSHFEQLWVRRLSDDAFEVCCIPFFLYGVALGDAVEVVEDSGFGFLLKRVLGSAGRSVFRVHFAESSADQQQVVANLVPMGALLEWSSSTLLAVDAGDSALARVVAGYLEELEGRGSVVFEVGATGEI